MNKSQLTYKDPLITENWKEYQAWYNMKQRCLNKKNTRYPRYGGRGISVCLRWHKFKNFFADMGKSPKGFTIERYNNNGNYEPSNCGWEPWSVQYKNRSKYNIWEYPRGTALRFKRKIRDIEKRVKVVYNHLLICCETGEIYKTLQDASDAHGITRERIRQIVARGGRTKHGMSFAKYRELF